MAYGKVKRLTCCICGSALFGRQWPNRDDGYGVCPACVAWLRETSRETEAEIKDLYGVEGVHFNIVKLQDE